MANSPWVGQTFRSGLFRNFLSRLKLITKLNFGRPCRGPHGTVQACKFQAVWILNSPWFGQTFRSGLFRNFLSRLKLITNLNFGRPCRGPQRRFRTNSARSPPPVDLFHVQTGFPAPRAGGLFPPDSNAGGLFNGDYSWKNRGFFPIFRWTFQGGFGQKGHKSRVSQKPSGVDVKTVIWAKKPEIPEKVRCSGVDVKTVVLVKKPEKPGLLKKEERLFSSFRDLSQSGLWGWVPLKLLLSHVFR